MRLKGTKRRRRLRKQIYLQINMPALNKTQSLIFFIKDVYFLCFYLKFYIKALIAQRHEGIHGVIAIC